MYLDRRLKCSSQSTFVCKSLEVITPQADPSCEQAFHCIHTWRSIMQEGAFLGWWVFLPADNSRTTMTGRAFFLPSPGSRWSVGDVQHCLQLSSKSSPETETTPQGCFLLSEKAGEFRDGPKAFSALSCKKKDQKCLVLTHVSDNAYVLGICHTGE